MPRSRSVVLWSVASLLILLVAATLLLLVHPVLFTGRYYEITIREVEHGPQGLVTITYDEALSYGARVSWQYTVSRGTGISIQGWNGGGRQFPRWPRKEREQVLALYLTSEEERAKAIGDSPAIRQRWVLEKGTYRIRLGDRLVLSRRQEPDGTAVESMIEITPDP